MMKPDRRACDRGAVDRRQSARWDLDRALRWRVFRGRRIRIGRLVQRALNGVVLVARTRDAASVGTHLLVCENAAIEELGFRSAVVTRIETRSNSTRAMFAEIEA